MGVEGQVLIELAWQGSERDSGVASTTGWSETLTNAEGGVRT